MSEPYYADDAVTIISGDCLEVLAGMDAGSVDAVVTDPPYGLGFMGKEWDGLPPGREWAEACLRVLKPGGYMLAFGGSRTWHRLASAVDDAGFEIRDSIAWLYGSGFPKSLDVSKAIDKASGVARDPGVPRVRLGDSKPYAYNAQDSGTAIIGERGARLLTQPASDDAATWAGWGTALKPAFEPIVVGRKPLAGTVAANVLTHGTGALNIDACRVGIPDNLGRPQGTMPQPMDWGNRSSAATFITEGHAAGRWPTNVVLDDTQAADLDRQTGVLTSGVLAAHHKRAPQVDSASFGDLGSSPGERGYGDSGGASRFFPTFRYEAKAPTFERPRGDDGTAHPTVKPLDLMRWLVRLVTPPGGLVLDPFLGSGTTAEACIVEGFRCIGIERDPDYAALAVKRLSKPIEAVLDFDGAA